VPLIQRIAWKGNSPKFGGTKKGRTLRPALRLLDVIR
jgi:hypothetical protein